MHKEILKYLRALREVCEGQGGLDAVVHGVAKSWT